MAKKNVKFSYAALYRVIGEVSEPHVRKETAEMRNRASAISAGFRTGEKRGFYGPGIGNQPTRYESDVKLYHGYWPVGLVYTGNYSAMKDNTLNNTLLKARG